MNTAAARNILNAAELELAADGAVAITKLVLLSAAREPSESTLLWNGLQRGEPVFCNERLFTVSIRVENEAGKIDLNAADVNTLASLLEAVGLGGIRASKMANAIKDFSRAYPERGLPGSQMTAKADRVGALPPKGGPFETTLELDQIADMDSQTFDRLLPLVTVYSGRADSLSLFASPAMEAALTPPGTGDIFLIRTEVFSSTGGRFVREAIVELTGDARNFETKEWRRGRPRSAVTHAGDVPKQATVGLPECQSLLR